MIVYLEREIFEDTQCRKLYLCDHELTEEYLIISSVDQCTCRKRSVVLCRSEHDQCRMLETDLFLRQNLSKEIVIDHQPINVVLLERNELQTNSEIVYICQEKNLPRSILAHLKHQLTLTETSIRHRTWLGDQLLKHSIFVQSIYGMYSILQQAKSNSFRLRRKANVGYFLSNIFVGILCSFILVRHVDLDRFISNEILFQTQTLTTWIKSIIEWLMHAPAGLKLNQPLVDFLARFYFYHIYLWSGYLEALVITVLPYLYQILAILCFCGISVAIGAMCDFLRLLTIHLYCFYIYAARLFNWQIRLLMILFRLFCGKKRNPLRNYRLDSHLCDIDQLFIVTLTFTILLFLLPSIFMYYAVFTSIWLITVLAMKMIRYVNQYLLQIPVYELYLWITGSRMIRGTPRLSVNYAYSTATTVCFNFHFDPVSFVTLYRVCNTHLSLSSLSFRQFFPCDSSRSTDILNKHTHFVQFQIRMNNGTFTLFDRYDVGCELGKGTYGIVRKAFDTRQQHDVAIKCVCLGDEGIPSTALREISLLRSLKHSNIIRLYDIQVNQPTGELFLFYECMEMDLYEYMKLYRQALPIDLSKSYLKQMLLGIDYIHSNSMLHRDLKPQNILIDWLGSLKLADFGLGRHFQMPMRMYTHEVVTLWYRAPEILLGAKIYSTSVDLWSIGTIFAEITHNRALFAGECEIDQLFRIFRTLGTPDDTIWPGFSSMPDHKKTFPQWKPQNMSQLLSNLSSDALELTLQMLIYDPDQRITAKTALESSFLQSTSSHLIIPPSINSTKNLSVNSNSTSSNHQSDSQ